MLRGVGARVVVVGDDDASRGNGLNISNVARVPLGNGTNSWRRVDLHAIGCANSCPVAAVGMPIDGDAFVLKTKCGIEGAVVGTVDVVARPRSAVEAPGPASALHRRGVVATNGAAVVGTLAQIRRIRTCGSLEQSSRSGCEQRKKRECCRQFSHPSRLLASNQARKISDNRRRFPCLLDCCDHLICWCSRAMTRA